MARPQCDTPLVAVASKHEDLGQDLAFHCSQVKQHSHHNILITNTLSQSINHTIDPPVWLNLENSFKLDMR